MKKLLSLIEDYLVYNIVWSSELNLFFTKIKFKLGVFLVKKMYVTLLINSIIGC